MVCALPKRVSYGFAPRFVRQLQLVAVAASARAQTPLQSSPSASASETNRVATSPTKMAQAQPLVSHTKAAPASAAPQRVPHTLIEALAATYSYQPALQAERAKLRATDENVPTALAGWRPTVVMAGTLATATA